MKDLTNVSPSRIRAFRHLLNGVARDRRHARTELEYLKNMIEDTGD